MLKLFLLLQNCHRSSFSSCEQPVSLLLLQEGYTDGIEAGKQLALQEGFNQGYRQGAELMVTCGQFRGTLK